MKHLMVFVLMVLLMVPPALVEANAGTFTTFDLPGSPQTVALGINPAGAITGFYSDPITFVAHGFLRAPDGTFTTFDGPGAEQTTPAGIKRLLKKLLQKGTRL
jgi:hypothetical protein